MDDLPELGAHDFKGVIRFTFTPDDGRAPISELVTIKDDDPKTLEKACALIAHLIREEHPVVKAWVSQASALAERIRNGQDISS